MEVGISGSYDVTAVRSDLIQHSLAQVALK